MTLAMVLVLINADKDIYGHNEQNGFKCERTGQDNEDGVSYD